MRQEFNAHHVKVVRVPTADNIDAPASLTDMIQGRAHFGGNQRMEDRHVNGRVDPDGLGDGQERRRPGHGLLRVAHIIGRAAEPAPTADREQEVETGLFSGKRNPLI